MLRIFLYISGLTLITTGIASAQSAPAESSVQKAVNAANDPTASVLTFLVQEFYTPNLHNLDGEQNVLQYRMAIPYQFNGTNNIFRLSLPYVSKTPNRGTGFSDISVFNLTTFKEDWGRWGAGFVAQLPTGSDGFSAEKWAVGPAIGFIKNEDWGIWGLFNQNVFTVGGDDDFPDVNASQIQPIINVGLGKGWSVGSSDMNFVYDWDEDKFTSIPLGLSLRKLQRLKKGRVQYSLSYEHNFYDDGHGPEDTINFQAKFQFPTR